MKGGHNTVWNPERDAALRRLHAEGLTAGKIAERLGVSRFAVWKRTSRLKLSTPMPPRTVEAPRQPSEQERQAAAAEAFARAIGGGR